MLPKLWLLVGSDRPIDRPTLSLIELSWTAKKTLIDIYGWESESEFICEQNVAYVRLHLHRFQSIWKWLQMQEKRLFIKRDREGDVNSRLTYGWICIFPSWCLTCKAYRGCPLIVNPTKKKSQEFYICHIWELGYCEEIEFDFYIVFRNNHQQTKTHLSIRNLRVHCNFEAGTHKGKAQENNAVTRP